MNWAGLGWAGAGLADWTGWQQKGQAADGTDCTRQVLHHSLGASLHRPAMPCRTRTSRPRNTEVQTTYRQVQPGFPQPVQSVQPVLTGCSRWARPLG